MHISHLKSHGVVVAVMFGLGAFGMPAGFVRADDKDSLPEAKEKNATKKVMHSVCGTSDAPWSKVVEWFAGVSGLAYVSNDKPPTGMFKAPPPKLVDGKVRPYSLDEIIGHLNSALRLKGYKLTIREDSFAIEPLTDEDLQNRLDVIHRVPND